MKKTNVILTVLLIGTMVISIILGYLLWQNFLSSKININSSTSSSEKMYLFQSNTSAEVTKLISGSRNINGECSGVCNADIKVNVDDKEINLNGVYFDTVINNISKVKIQLTYSRDNYYTLRTNKTQTEKGNTYLFNDRSYLSVPFCSTTENGDTTDILLENNYFFTDCGQDAYYSQELVTGISVLNIPSGQITQILKPVTGKKDLADISYSIYSINDSDLIVLECTYIEHPETNPSYACTTKSIDISPYLSD